MHVLNEVRHSNDLLYSYSIKKKSFCLNFFLKFYTKTIENINLTQNNFFVRNKLFRLRHVYDLF